jgi:hypothetical protein
MSGADLKEGSDLQRRVPSPRRLHRTASAVQTRMGAGRPRGAFELASVAFGGRYFISSTNKPITQM